MKDKKKAPNKTNDCLLNSKHSFTFDLRSIFCISGHNSDPTVNKGKEDTKHLLDGGLVLDEGETLRLVILCSEFICPKSSKDSFLNCKKEIKMKNFTTFLL